MNESSSPPFWTSNQAVAQVHSRFLTSFFFSFHSPFLRPKKKRLFIDPLFYYPLLNFTKQEIAAQQYTRAECNTIL